MNGPPTLHEYNFRTGTVATLFTSERQIAGVTWAPDSEEILFFQRPGGGVPNGEIWSYARSSGESRPLFAVRGGSGSGTVLDLSPDGRWLLYTSRETGRPEVFVRSYPELAAPRQVSSGGGSSAHWADDGRTIYYLSAVDEIMAVSVGADVASSLGTPSVVMADDRYTDLWGVSADGAQYLRHARIAGAEAPYLIVGWQERARRAVSGGN